MTEPPTQEKDQTKVYRGHGVYEDPGCMGDLERDVVAEFFNNDIKRWNQHLISIEKLHGAVYPEGVAWKKMWHDNPDYDDSGCQPFH